MADTTNIQWCASPDGSKGATWSPITGCSFEDDSCHGCYAAQLAATRLKHIESRKGLAEIRNGVPVWSGEVRFNPQWLEQPLHWKRGRRIFVCAHSDLFHENVPDEWIDKIFAVMALATQHTFLVLTKRAERMRSYITDRDSLFHMASIAFDISNGTVVSPTWPLPNVGLGVSFGRQVKAAERLYHLLQTLAAWRWCSYEPALELVNFNALQHNDVAFSALEVGVLMPTKLDWGVIGGESGRRARPFDLQWVVKTIESFRAAGAPLFVKQLGGKPFDSGEPEREFKLGSHGSDIGMWPLDLRVREYPA